MFSTGTFYLINSISGFVVQRWICFTHTAFFTLTIWCFKWVGSCQISLQGFSWPLHNSYLELCLIRYSSAFLCYRIKGCSIHKKNCYKTSFRTPCVPSLAPFFISYRLFQNFPGYIGIIIIVSRTLDLLFGKPILCPFVGTLRTANVYWMPDDFSSLNAVTKWWNIVHCFDKISY